MFLRGETLSKDLALLLWDFVDGTLLYAVLHNFFFARLVKCVRMTI